MPGLAPHACDAGPVADLPPAPGAGARARARAELVREITDAARAQLAEVGAAALSVRSVTRALGMAPSAVYRYFPSRDALLTALITDAYVGLGDAVAAAEARVARADLLGRWLAVHRAVRSWALARPHEYALIYGSPVPGYVAPQDTVVPATRVALLLARVAVDAWLAGHRAAPGPAVPDALRADGRALVAAALAPYPDAQRPDLDAVDPRVALAVVDGWTELFGCVGFELFGHYHRVFEARAAHLDAVARRTAAAAGIPVGEAVS